ASFFFQAEDGIRDYKVTGVQTCALPILPFSAENQIAVVTMHMHRPPPSPRSISQNISLQVERVIFKALEKKPELRYSSATELARSEERRVGKESRSRGVTYQ